LVVAVEKGTQLWCNLQTELPAPFAAREGGA